MFVCVYVYVYVWRIDIASARGDNGVRGWRRKRGRKVAVLMRDGVLGGCVLTGDGDFAGCGLVHHEDDGHQREPGQGAAVCGGEGRHQLYGAEPQRDVRLLNPVQTHGHGSPLQPDQLLRRPDTEEASLPRRYAYPIQISHLQYNVRVEAFVIHLF